MVNNGILLSYLQLGWRDPYSYVHFRVINNAYVKSNGIFMEAI